MEERRRAYADQLAILAADAKAEDFSRDLGAEVGSAQPFFLPYQGRNDRDLQSAYGNIICAAALRRFGAATLAPPPRPGEKLRVGIVSGFFRMHSNWKMRIRSWLERIDRSRFEVFGYYTGEGASEVTAQAAQQCQRFVRGQIGRAHV